MTQAQRKVYNQQYYQARKAGIQSIKSSGKLSSKVQEGDIKWSKRKSEADLVHEANLRGWQRYQQSRFDSGIDVVDEAFEEYCEMWGMNIYDSKPSGIEAKSDRAYRLIESYYDNDPTLTVDELVQLVENINPWN